jgi:hypothetical protein
MAEAGNNNSIRLTADDWSTAGPISLPSHLARRTGSSAACSPPLNECRAGTCADAARRNMATDAQPLSPELQ